MSTFHITEVKPEHLDAIKAIENKSFSLPWTFSQLGNQMNNENCIFLVALNDGGEVCGYIGCQTVLDEGYISNIAVAPVCRKNGVADALLTELKRLTILKKLAFLTLEVRESNIPAISLYRKHSFSLVGRREGYYDKPKEAALLLTCFL